MIKGHAPGQRRQCGCSFLFLHYLRDSAGPSGREGDGQGWVNTASSVGVIVRKISKNNNGEKWRCLSCRWEQWPWSRYFSSILFTIDNLIAMEMIKTGN